MKDLTEYQGKVLAALRLANKKSRNGWSDKVSVGFVLKHYGVVHDIFYRKEEKALGALVQKGYAETQRVRSTPGIFYSLQYMSVWRTKPTKSR